MKIPRILFTAFIVICVLLSVIVPTAVYAFISQPDSTPGFSNLHANRNLLTDGDMLVYGDLNLPYAVEPTTLSSDAFYISLLSSNGTLVATNVPYSYFNYGYNQIAFSLYITDNTTWGTECTLRLSENPALFATPVNYDTTLYAADYSTQTSRLGNQAELASKVIEIAQYIQPYYPLVTFLQSVSGSFKLASPTGETYFIGVIPLLQYMAPTLFLLQSYSADTASSNWTTAQFDIYADRFAGTWVGVATNATAVQLNLTPMMITSMVIILPLCVGAIIVSSRKYQRAEPGYIFCVLVLNLGAVMGWMPAALYAAINQLLGIYLGYVLFYSRG